MNAPFTEKDNPQEAKAHTSGPWEVYDGANIRAVGGRPIGTASGPHSIGATPEIMERRRQEREEERANADFIVRACNSHEELLEALEAQERLAEHISHCPKCIDPEHRGICAGAAAMAMPVNEKRHNAIARAKGEAS